MSQIQKSSPDLVDWGIGACVILFAFSLASPQSSSQVATNVKEAYKDVKEYFKGGQQSVVARVVGAAEGTRSVDGGFTNAYTGHSDPGNSVWNIGSFSYQHGASSPEEADEKQLARLERQTDELLDKAANKGLQLTTEEVLNAVDLANQAPLAALDSKFGYINRLRECETQGKKGSEKVLCARTLSYYGPSGLEAPGLGNVEENVRYDQQRRMDMIEQAKKNVLK